VYCSCSLQTGSGKELTELTCFPCRTFDGGIFALLKDFDYHEAVVLFTLFFLLLPCRKYFYRKSSLMHQSFSQEEYNCNNSVLVSFVWARILFIPKRRIFKRALGGRFGINSQASSFLRATVGVFFMLLVFGLQRCEPFSRDIHIPGKEEMEACKNNN